MTDELLSGSIRHDDVIVPRGFPVEILGDRLNSKYQCAVCCLVLRDPFQGTCGHRFCKDCVDHLLADSSSSNDATHPICIACREEDTVDDSSNIRADQMYRDVALRKEMSVLAVHCCNVGCQWTGQFKDYENHIGACDHVLIQCEYCRERISRNLMERHTSSEHMLMTAKPGQLCPFSCGMTIDENGIRKHIETNLQVHLDILNEKLQFVEQLVLPAQRSTSNSLSSTLLERIVQLEQKMAELDDRFRSIASTQIPEHQSPETSSVPITEEPEVDFRGLPEFLDVLIRGAKVVKREQERISLRLASFVTQCAEDMIREQTLQGVIEAQEKAAAFPELDELKLRMERLETMTTDGVLIWKITDFDRRRLEAAEGIRTSFYSPPFFTHPTGYKMCARIYLNGDGTGKGSHVSLFFVVMRGNYDALLSWPFSLQVSLAILDQDDGTRSHSESFRADVTSTSFRRPTADMNPASGYPNFMPLRLLEMRNSRSSFVKDNVMFVKVTVESQRMFEIHKSLLNR